MRLVAGEVSKLAKEKEILSLTVEAFSNDAELNMALGEGLCLVVIIFSSAILDKKEKGIPNINCCYSGFLSKRCNFSRRFECGRRLLVSDGVHPANIATPSKLEALAREIASSSNVNIKVMEREEFTEIGMGGLAGVAQGTDEPPKFIVIEYMNGGDEKPKNSCRKRSYI